MTGSTSSATSFCNPEVISVASSDFMVVLSKLCPAARVAQARRILSPTHWACSSQGIHKAS
jgi:hypothetical protein